MSALQKNIGEGEETLLTFPTPFPIKAMGRMKAEILDKGDGGDKLDKTGAHQQFDPAFAQTVLSIIQKHAPDFDAHTLEMRASKNGNFISVTATINATSKAQLDNIYRELSSHPAVLMAL